MTAKKSPPLDLLSTSQTTVFRGEYVDTDTGEVGEPERTRSPDRCVYGAPMVAMVLAGRATIGQACCNHWDCPKCGMKRAKQEYRRIVLGAEQLSMGHKLYFWTITCRGRECSYDEAISNYLLWTNRLLTNARTKAKREDQYWAYAQVTEHQKKTRKHPHSHLLCTFKPLDARETKDAQGRPIIVSEWFSSANFTSGLGNQHKITEVTSAAAVSRYIAKYMFKESVNEIWPSGWKRVRYSQNWPNVPAAVPDFVSVLLSKSDWDKVASEGMVFTAETPADYERSLHYIANVKLQMERKAK